MNRARQIEAFRRMLDGQATRRIMVISAGPGMGKSWQLGLFAQMAAERNRPLVQIDFADGQAYDALLLVRRCRDAFGAERFNPVTQAINEATTARLTISGPTSVPTTVSATVGQENTLINSTVTTEVGTIIKDNYFVLQADNPLVRQALEDRINSAFFGSLNELTASSQAVFLFDTYERTSLEADRWLPGEADRWVTGQLLTRIRDGKLKNVIVVLAGRRVPEFGVEWNEVLGRMSLDPLECGDVDTYLRQRRNLAMISDAEVDRLCQAVAGNPQVLGIIGDNLEQANVPQAKDDEW